MEALTSDRHKASLRALQPTKRTRPNVAERKAIDLANGSAASDRRDTEEAIQRQQVDNMDDQEWQAALYGQLAN